jgi:TatD DNase family protein
MTNTGVYNGKQVHKSDVDDVIRRSRQIGCDHLLIASGHVEDAIKAFELCQRSPDFYTTIGVHPCRAS